MPDLTQLLLFMPAVLALNLTPGNDMLFCLGQGMKSGARAGIAASLGIATGSLINTVLAATGLSALLANTPVALTFLAFIPQFVDRERGSTVLQFLTFGIILNLTGTPINSLVGMYAGSLKQRLSRQPSIGRLLQYVTSIIFLGLAAKLIFDSSEI